ncbi:uncharacterized protein N7482_007379 [Penicillium canariense]|uniref:Uncharacterized protein n=1 Tax=Penicillium canariense TaxID=189055 RepID=A0A9W9I1K6_9EURO|nr:uncharacterized protein N7482_007379 [Penicillium canariense]KAJ5160375.1 hypothetical protein N7482_007379 [Penicillium canariense]
MPGICFVCDLQLASGRFLEHVTILFWYGRRSIWPNHDGLLLGFGAIPTCPTAPEKPVGWEFHLIHFNCNYLGCHGETADSLLTLWFPVARQPVVHVQHRYLQQMPREKHPGQARRMQAN